MDNSNSYDVIIIGCGIIGAFMAKELCRYDLKVLVLEQTSDIGAGATKANSGLLYPGFHPRGGSLKGISAVKGNAMFDDLTKELGIGLKRTGGMYLFFQKNQERFAEKYQNGLINKVPKLEIISGDQVRSLEPLVNKKVTKALYTPSAGLISPFELIWATTSFAALNNTKFKFNTIVTDLKPKAKPSDQITVITNQGQFKADFVVNAAGGGASVIESWVRPQDLVIKPRRGQYYIFDKQKKPPIKHILYQVQEDDEKGTLLAPTIDGNLIAGPTSEDVPSYKNTETTYKSLAHIRKVSKKILPSIDFNQVIANFAGVRANIKNVAKEKKDFVLRSAIPGLVSALGIKNPGITSAPYLVKQILKDLQDQGLNTIEKADYINKYHPVKPFLQQDSKTQKALFAKDKRYGEILCRCEEITYGDVASALKSPIAPHNISGIKMRLRVGMGRCQGSFCTHRLIAFLAQEMNLSPKEINKYDQGSNYVKGYLK